MRFPVRLLTCLLPVLLISAGGHANAQKSPRGDRAEPIQVEADRMSYDDARQTNVFTGRVLLTRGTVSIRADRLVLRQDASGNQFAQATGAPASFRQRRGAQGEIVEGSANTLEYDSQSETVRLRDQASMRRLEGERVVNEVFGNEIVYESRTEHFTVERGDAARASAQNPGGRVRVIIQPKSQGSSRPSKQPPALKSSDTLKPRSSGQPSR